MACDYPVRCWYAKDVNPSGKRSLVHNPRYALEADNWLLRACGQCVGCRMKYARNWAMRCHHESSLHSENSFLTLTFSSEFLPVDGQISVRDCQLFMKRFRKMFSSVPIRMAYCGEYGENFGRPHYHFLIFGFDFFDKYHWRKTQAGFPVYRSEILERLWPFGHCEIGDVTLQSCGYVSRYMLKKHKGPSSDEELFINFETGEITGSRRREFFHMSRKPGIARKWFDVFYSDVYPKDFVTIDGVKYLPPKYYDTLFEKIEPYVMEEVKFERENSARFRAADNTPERLTVKAKVKEAQIKLLKREYESGT